MTKTSILFFVIFFCVYFIEQATFLDLSYIDNINKNAQTWKAEVDHYTKMWTKSFLRFSKTNVKINNFDKTNDPMYKFKYKNRKYFDARKFWHHCKNIGTIRNQGKCGSCWAFASAGAFADRLCIATGGKFNQQLSIEELTFCCVTCGNGCNGGIPIKAWEYFSTIGIVTGGDYNTFEGCQPYRIKPCLHYQEGEDSCDSQSNPPIQSCVNYCYGDNTIDIYSDRRKTLNSYYLNPDSIRKDVEVYGPVTVEFKIYDDFLHYKKGVYQRTANAKFRGYHVGKLIGWGVENGTDYWLVANSWGTRWGDQGLFKIRRGNNECGIECLATGGVPLV